MSIEHKTKDSTSQLCSFVRGSYLDRTSRPIYALGYLAFFIILYEIGTLLINPATFIESLSRPQIRVVAFVWIQNLLEHLGFSARLTWLTTPLVVVVILLWLQITSRTRWSVRVKDFLPMTVECVALAVPLVVLSLMVNRASPAQMPQEDYTIAARSQVVMCQNISPAADAVDAGQMPRLLADIITGIGAGIYEELVFRLILICLLLLMLEDFLGMNRPKSIILAVLISAVLFSAHHHIFFVNGRLGAGEIFSVGRFIFRALAGVYFAVLFAVRGFGITAGTHAFYNILAAIVNVYLSSVAG
ncbi:MAG: CPBP family glutamic-type intramembrane protease [Planctomycetota bacterium]|jgi:hypothetical protein